MSRRTLRVLGLTLIIAMIGSAFVANADAKKLSKAQKHAISKKLMRAVKHNPKVISKRWFLKQASLVSFSLPSTIRLDPFAGQNGERLTTGSDAYPRSRAILDLGPSLGTRTIPLSGALHANINFNDAFDGGHLGDVRITLPPDPSANLSTTAVPLLTNTNVTNNTGNADAPNDEINGFAIAPNPNPPGPPSLGALIMLKVGSDPTPRSVAGGYNLNAITCGNFSYTSYVSNGNKLTPSVAAACLAFGDAVRDAIGTSTAIGATTRNVYAAAVPAAVAKKNDAVTGAIGVHTVFVGAYNETVVGGISGLAAPAGGFAPANPTGTMLIQLPYSAGTSTIQVPAHLATRDQQGMGGCGNWDGNGATIPGHVDSGLDVDLPSKILATNDPGNDNAVGSGAVSPDGSATPGDVVLRTGALALNIAAPSNVMVPGDNEDNPGSSVNYDYAALATSIRVPFDDAAAFAPGQNLTITDGFKSNTAQVDDALNAVYTGAPGDTASPAYAVVNLETTGPNNGNLLTGAGQAYPAGSIVSIVGEGVVTKKSVGTSGGRANLFGQPINGLAKGNSVDVTVNLATDIHSIAREVDSSPAPYGGPSVTTTLSAPASLGDTVLSVSSTTGFATTQQIAIGGDVSAASHRPTEKATITAISPGVSITVDTDPATAGNQGLAHAHDSGDYVSYTPETQANINTYSDCRQAWTGSVRNYLTGIKLVGSLRVAPALTADGKVRIAKVNLRTPAAVPESLAACLTPYQLFMDGVPGLSLDPQGEPAPNLIGGAIFNPLVVLAGSSEGVSPKPSVGCNSNGGPLARHPFNVYPNGASDLKSMLENGAAVGVSGTLRTTIKAEVIIGTFNK